MTSSTSLVQLTTHFITAIQSCISSQYIVFPLSQGGRGRRKQNQTETKPPPEPEEDDDFQPSFICMLSLMPDGHNIVISYIAPLRYFITTKNRNV